MSRAFISPVAPMATRLLPVFVCVLHVATSQLQFDLNATIPASKNVSRLTLTLMTPSTGKLGFERNAAASTMALAAAQRDGLLPGFSIRSVYSVVDDLCKSNGSTAYCLQEGDG